MNSDILREITHARLLTVQRLHRYIVSTQFEKAANLANREQFTKLKMLTENSDFQGLKNLVDEILFDEIESKSVADLRKLGRDHRVKDYGRLSKASLLAAILEKVSDANQHNHTPEQSGDLHVRDETPCIAIGDQGRYIQSVD